MKLRLALIFIVLFPLGPSLRAQSLQPQFIDSITDHEAASCGTFCSTYPEPLNTGELLVLYAAQMDGTIGCVVGSLNPPWNVTDSLGNTWVNETATVTPSVLGSTNNYQQFSHTLVTVPGNDDITVPFGTTSCGEKVYIARFKNVSGNVDATSIFFTGPSGGILTLTTSTSATANGDLLVSGAVDNSGPQGQTAIGTNMQFIAQRLTALPEINPSVGFAIGGAAGTLSQTMYRYGGNAAQSAVMQTIAFLPSTLATTLTITDGALPHAALSTAYSYTIHGQGGAGAYTCSITAGSLPTGISLTGTGNCTISGTPSASGAFSITFQIDDGVNTPATATLTLTVDFAVGTPSYTIGPSGNFNAAGGGATFSLTGISCNDIAVIQVQQGSDTFVPAVSGTNNYVVDSWGSPIVRSSVVGGTPNGAVLNYILGPVARTGIDSVTVKNNVGATSGEVYQVIYVHHAQAVVDPSAFANNVGSSSPYTLTTPFVVPVDNSLVLSSTNAPSSSPSTSVTIASPFTSTAGSGTKFDFGVATALSAGSYNHVATISLASANEAQSTVLTEFRPGANTTCPTLIRHRSWFQQ